MAGRFVTLTALVTRPQPQADSWVQSLRGQGVDALALPLIGIGAPPRPYAVADIWRQMANYRALMFVSPAAVQWFFQQRPDGVAWSTNTWAAAPGPGTAQALRMAGQQAALDHHQVLTPAHDAAQFDSEHLWPVLAELPWAGQKVAILSGGDNQEAKGRTWLTQQWQAQGADVETVLTYQRGPAPWHAEEHALATQALSAPHHHVWLFSSSEAIGFLRDLSADVHPVPWHQLRALTTHPRITETARSFGISDIIETRPDLNEVVQALRSASPTT